MRSVLKVRRTRGLSCEEVSVKATSVTVKLRPATETVAVATELRTPRASSSEANSRSGSLGSSRSSSAGSPKPRTTATPIATAERNPKLARS